MSSILSNSGSLLLARVAIYTLYLYVLWYTPARTVHKLYLIASPNVIFVIFAIVHLTAVVASWHGHHHTAHHTVLYGKTGNSALYNVMPMRCNWTTLRPAAHTSVYMSYRTTSRPAAHYRMTSCLIKPNQAMSCLIRCNRTTPRPITHKNV